MDFNWDWLIVTILLYFLGALNGAALVSKKYDKKFREYVQGLGELYIEYSSKIHEDFVKLTELAEELKKKDQS
jgi:hypothetical protein